MAKKTLKKKMKEKDIDNEKKDLKKVVDVSLKKKMEKASPRILSLLKKYHRSRVVIRRIDEILYLLEKKKIDVIEANIRIDRVKKLNKLETLITKDEYKEIREWSKKRWEELSGIVFKKPYMEQIEIEQNKTEKWFNLRSLLGNDWAMFYFLLGGRGVGKSYAVTKEYLEQFLNYGRVFYWLRLTETSKNKLLANKAEKLIDPDIRKCYDLDITTNGDNVYLVTERDKNGKIKKQVLMASLKDLKTFYSDKGSALYDKDLLDDPIQYYNICLDEMNREANERKTFDIVYAFANQLENLIRKEKDKVRIICIGNTIAEASDLLRAFDFIPQEFGEFKLKNKRAVIEYSEMNDEQSARTHASAGDIVSGNKSTFTNEVKLDYSLVEKREKKHRALCILKFSNDESEWFTVWNERLVTRYNNDLTVKGVITMRRYVNGIYDKDSVNEIFSMYEYQQFRYDSIATQIMFESQLQMIKAK